MFNLPPVRRCMASILRREWCSTGRFPPEPTNCYHFRLAHALGELWVSVTRTIVEERFRISIFIWMWDLSFCFTLWLTQFGLTALRWLAEYLARTEVTLSSMIQLISDAGEASKPGLAHTSSVGSMNRKRAADADGSSTAWSGAKWLWLSEHNIPSLKTLNCSATYLNVDVAGKWAELPLTKRLFRGLLSWSMVCRVTATTRGLIYPAAIEAYDDVSVMLYHTRFVGGLIYLTEPGVSTFRRKAESNLLWRGIHFCSLWLDFF